MLIFTGFYAFYGACLVIASTAFPGWANIYLSPTTLGSISMCITFGFAGGFTGGYFASRGDPFWTVSGGLAGVIGVSAGADVYAPTLAYLISALTAVCAVYAGNLDRDEGTGGRRGRRGRRCTACRASSGSSGSGIFAAGYPTGVNNVDSSIGGQLIGVATFVPLGFLTGWLSAWVLKKLNLLRVPPEVEIAGLDTVEYVPGHLPAGGRGGASHAGRAGRDAGGGRPADPGGVLRADVTAATARAGDELRRRDASHHRQRARLHRPQGGLQRRTTSPTSSSQNNYQDCAGFMTFGPGSTYGDGGTGAADGVHGPDLDRHRLHGDRPASRGWPTRTGGSLAFAAKNALGMGRAPTDEPPPQPGLVD